ncbi:potassium transporter Kup [Pararhizobium mangrovi]|uniref:Probable potassium transport system protein Kup n=1 Tax=Pararhizobium mangrovi TaxID=2590452 RepID=A0A506UG65_9HYPH|nr:KUP/HAK/KT family potassium transporter [Pararhizobium mangrovi]TPW31989.1 KUP/HAK/KT family potassium transporter [Pararhizobium mangrovi]
MSQPPEVEAQDRAGRAHAAPDADADDRQTVSQRLKIGLGVLGVVYGDLGTCSIYALHTVFTGGTHPLDPSAVNVIGILSLVFWTLIVVVSVKYMAFVLRADNRGEGGTFALIALLRPWRHIERRRRHALVLLGLAGAAMLYAGVMITPAISILSAVEGLEVASAGMGEHVISVTLVILVLLFVAQRFGTQRIGAAFGPVMAVWFLSIAALGIYGIAMAPRVLFAVNPIHAVAFFYQNGLAGFLVLFAVFLVTTGAEALYADIGHFGRRPIRRLWFFFVLPSLMLNYFGQSALLLTNPEAVSHPFFRLIPDMFLYPMVILATMATIIASQAAITGAFSMTRQAARLGMMPPSRVIQTSEEAAGQVYVPFVNWMLMVSAIILVVLFQSSDRLASTYGISVSTAMVVTTILAFFVARERGRWSLWAALALLVGFLFVDLAYFGSNLLRIPHGGWFPIIVAILFFTIMSTWRRGRDLLTRRSNKESKTVEEVVQELADQEIARVPGTAIFLTSHLKETPPLLFHHIERNRALQKQVVLLTVLVEDVPRTTREERLQVEDLGDGFYRVVLHYGYMQGINVPSELANGNENGLDIDLDETTYYIEHQSPISGKGRHDGMAAWRDRLLDFLMRNSSDATTGYHIPADKAVELGMRVRI